MQGTVEWPLLLFLLTLIGGSVFFSVKVLLYALNIRRDIDLRIAVLATKEDISNLSTKLEAATKETSSRFDTIWNEGTSRHNNLAEDINQVRDRVSRVEGQLKAAPYNG